MNDEFFVLLYRITESLFVIRLLCNIEIEPIPTIISMSFLRAHVSFRSPVDPRFYKEFYQDMHRLGWYKRPWPGEYTAKASLFHSRPRLIAAIKSVAQVYVDPKTGSVSVMISEEPKLDRPVATRYSGKNQLIRLLQAKLSLETERADACAVWEAIDKEACDVVHWEKVTLSLAAALDVEYYAGDGWFLFPFLQ